MSLQNTIIWFFIFGLTACNNAGFQISPQLQSKVCDIETQNGMEFFKAKQNQWYQSKNSKPPSKYDASEFDAPEISNSKAVVLIHGFISSPEAMKDLKSRFINAGYSVVTPLMTGFGAESIAANNATFDDWQNAILESIALASKCHSEVHVVAHSLGTAVVNLSIAEGKVTNIKSLTLLAPFIKIKSGWIEPLLTSVEKTSAETISFSLLSQTIGNSAYDLFGIDKPKEGEVDPYLPIKALKNALALQDSFEKINSRYKIKTLAIISESDSVIDPEAARKFITDKFEQSSLALYPADLKISHSLQDPAHNSQFNMMAQQILDFFQN